MIIRKKNSIKVVFGDFEFIEKGENGSKAIVHRIHNVVACETFEEADEIAENGLAEQGHESYLIPAEYRFPIVPSSNLSPKDLISFNECFL